MIKTLRIQDYTIIDELSTAFENGLNVITGETGAGKSIMIDAIDIALGAKASKETIKAGKNRALIELEIELSEKTLSLIKSTMELGIEEKELIVTREITPTSSRVRVNGVMISQNELSELRKLVLDIHSQHQTYTYLQPKTHINLLDNFGSKEYAESIAAYKNLYKEYQNKLQKLKKLKDNDNQNKEQAEFLKFQIDEITSAEISDINEFDDLTAKSHVLENAQELKSVSYNAYEAIYGENENITDSLDKVKSFLDKISNCDENLHEITKNLDGIISDLKETARDLRNYSDNLDCDEETLNTIQSRLEILSKIRRKYGGSLEEALNKLDKLQEEYEFIGNSEEVIARLEKEISENEEQLLLLAKNISEVRKTLAQTLSETVTEKLKFLEMPYAQFKVDVRPVELCANGIDEVEFMIITNPAEDFKPLVKVASGGEISRVMLAIKSVFANTDDIGTVIFDEIDTGVSGKTSQAIASQLSELAKTHQILCITHQPIIAAWADTHFHVNKVQREDNVEVQVKKLSMEERESVLAKMLSGSENSVSLNLAKEMLGKTPPSQEINYLNF